MRKWTSEIGEEDVDKEVTLYGWIHEVRDLGGLIFLILRDREGFIQLTLPKKKVDPETFKIAKKIRRESVVKVVGTVKKESKAPGGYEVIPKTIEVLNEAEAPS